ncbi:hypothetical protein ACROYT_G030075 [Oculina patagonica]
MPTFGKLDEYNETEDWRHYIERVNYFFEANEITDPDNKRSIFLVSVGAKTYKLIRSLVAPEDPKDKSYENSPRNISCPSLPLLYNDSSLTLGLNNQKHAQLFRKGLWTLQGRKAKILVVPTANPIFHKARPVPYTLRKKIEQDLERLEKAGTIEPVQYSEWATNIVPVTKSDGTVRVCGDYNLTVNKVSKLDGYPLPKLDDL